MSAEKFMVEFLRALKANETIGFKGRLRSADLLLIDDVQFIAGKEFTQEEFFHTMNEIITAGRRLVITLRPRPQDLDGVAPRILSRLSLGPGRRYQRRRLRAAVQHHRSQAGALPGVEMPRNVVDIPRRAG